MERAYFDVEQARAAYTELLRLFPNGYLAFDARKALERMSQSAIPQAQPHWSAPSAPLQPTNMAGQPQQMNSGPAASDLRTRADFLDLRDSP
jgi:hypothetical protein